MPSAIPPSLRKEDFTDREMAWILHECIESDDYAALEDMVLMLGAKEDDIHLRRCLSSRLSVMARGDLKLVKRHPNDPRRWKLTARGDALRTGSLRKAVENALNKMDENEQVVLVTEATRRSVIEGSALTAAMSRRVFDYSMAHRRNGRRR